MKNNSCVQIYIYIFFLSLYLGFIDSQMVNADFGKYTLKARNKKKNKRKTQIIVQERAVAI